MTQGILRVARVLLLCGIAFHPPSSAVAQVSTSADPVDGQNRQQSESVTVASRFLRFDQYTTIDIQKHDVGLSVDVSKGTIRVQSKLVFCQPERAVPLFDLKPQIGSISIDGVGLEPSRLKFVSAPDDSANYIDIGVALDAGIHTLRVNYELTSRNTPRCRFECSVNPTGSTRKLIPAVQSFEDATQLDFLMAVMDYAPATYGTDGRTFLERYIPCGQEDDLHSLSIDVDVFGTDVPHQIIANGAVEGLSVQFPSHTSCSSAYFHIIPVPRYFVTEKSVLAGGKSIDLTVYSTRAAGEEFHLKSVANVERGLVERANEIGFYPNDSFVAHLYPKAGGMEYTGATSCAPSALRHEITHSWFGRGVRPSTGADGWIDEAITTWWVDRRGRFPDSPPGIERIRQKRLRKLSFESRYFRMTPAASYGQGAEFIAYLASVYSAGGKELKPVLIDFARQNMHRPVTTEQFLEFVISRAPESAELEEATRQYVYGSPDE